MTEWAAELGQRDLGSARAAGTRPVIPPAGPMCPWRDFEIIAIYRHGHVVSCEEAAAARGVPLSYELKSIILRVRQHYVGVHIRGDQKLNSKSVRKALRTKRIRFAKANELADFGLQMGRINPTNTRFCQTHLVCLSVFDRPFLTTNDGTFEAGVAFSPFDLFTLPFVLVGSFSYD